MNVGDEVKLLGRVTELFEGPLGQIANVHFAGFNGAQQVRIDRLQLNDSPADWQEDLA